MNKSIYKLIKGFNNFTPVKVGGLDISYWLDLFGGCHTNGSTQFAWPDGGNYLDQDNLTVLVFRMIQEQINKVNDNGK